MLPAGKFFRKIIAISPDLVYTGRCIGHPSLRRKQVSSPPVQPHPAASRRGRQNCLPRLSVSKKSFRHAEAFFRASKSSEKWGSSSCRTPFPGFPHTPFRPVDESVPLFWQVQGGPERMLRPYLIFGYFSTGGVPCRITPPRGDSSPRRRNGGRGPRDRPRYPRW